MGESSSSSDHRPQFSPLVRRLAQEHDIDPETLVGTGPGGRVTRSDVLREAFGEHESPDELQWAREPEDPTNAEARAEPAPEPGPQPETEPEPETQREAQAELVPVPQQPAEAPTFSVFVDIDASQLFRAQDRLAGQRTHPVDVDALLIRLVVPPLSEFPRLNGTLEAGIVEESGRRNIGFVFEGNGEVDIIVVGGAEELTLQDLDQAVVELKQRAEHDQLSINETSGQTFTICNLGSLGATAAAAALPPETTAIVTYGKSREVVVMGDDGPQTTKQLTIAGTFSSSAINMVDATRFLARLATYLEDPILAFAD